MLVPIARGANDHAYATYFATSKAVDMAYAASRFTNGFEVALPPLGFGLGPPQATYIPMVAAVVATPAFQELVSDTTSGPSTRGLRLEVLVWTNAVRARILFGAHFAVAERSAFDSMEARCRFYLEGLADGHSTNFLNLALLHSKEPEVAETLGLLTSPRDVIWTPKDWPGRTNDIQQGLCVVVDGPFAWTYLRGEFSGKCDAKEFSPTLRGQFESARTEAEADLYRQGIQGVDNGHLFNMDLQRILKRRYGIDWLTPDQIGADP